MVGRHAQARAGVSRGARRHPPGACVRRAAAARRARAPRRRPGCHVILASSSPGIFGGDVFEQHIVLEPGARVRLTSQSALQVHPGARGGAARLRTIFEVARRRGAAVSLGPADPVRGEPVWISRSTSGLRRRRVCSGATRSWPAAKAGASAGSSSICRHELRVTRGADGRIPRAATAAAGGGRVARRVDRRRLLLLRDALASGWSVARRWRRRVPTRS